MAETDTYQELGSQGLTPQAGATDGEPRARVEWRGAGGGGQCLMFVTYLVIEEQRRNEEQGGRETGRPTYSRKATVDTT